ncbi:winged helix-turn-helix domain-containing protein [Sphingomonas sp. BK235]|uniref:winged helix-turn-helix domain-containing protein n=1 Tax=Sphingomonas sp. BK235 TaxID=2512131 RepID=UPI0010DAE735|nr:winged helix-turn-helix domain-containing protein [Sphingomonas sp. BK235]TCP36068.1 DNA-binding winged helix-turn-helix (wHTH) protein [Sphingomonas sp. BK235]
MRLLFEDFTLDLAAGELRRDGVAVAVAPKVFDLLRFLIERRDALVTKDDVLSGVWGGRIVSESTMSSHVNAVRRAVRDDGVQQRIIRTVARKGFRFVASVQTAASPMPVSAPERTPFPLTCATYGTLPSIGVLPMAVYSADPLHRHFAEGLREELLVALANTPLLEVGDEWLGRDPAGKPLELARARARYDYELEGSVRGAGPRLRVSMRLLETASGLHLWADSIDLGPGDALDLQETIARRARGALDRHLRRAETFRAARKAPETLTAYDHYLIGQAYLKRGGQVDLQRALASFYAAITLDPEFQPPYAAAAWTFVMRKQGLWMKDIERESAEGARLAQMAVTSNNDDPTALVWGSYALGHFGEDLDVCTAYMNKALRLNPNSSLSWYLSGGQLLSAGRHDEALLHIDEAADRGPDEKEASDISILRTLAHLLNGHSDEASLSSAEAFALAPDNPRALGLVAASHAAAGRVEDASRGMTLLRRHGPQLRVGTVRQWVHLRRKEDLEVFAGGLSQAGLPM